MKKEAKNKEVWTIVTNNAESQQCCFTVQYNTALFFVKEPFNASFHLLVQWLCHLEQ